MRSESQSAGRGLRAGQVNGLFRKYLWLWQNLNVAFCELGEEAAGGLNIVVRRGAKTRDFLRRDGADDFSGRAHHDRPCWDRFSSGDERVSPDQTIIADHGVVHDRGADADQAIVADPASVQKSAMPDGAAAPNLEWDALVGVEDAMLLNIGLMADFEKLVVATKHGPIPNRDATAERDLADDTGAGCDEKIADGGKLWGHSIEG